MTLVVSKLKTDKRHIHFCCGGGKQVILLDAKKGDRKQLLLFQSTWARTKRGKRRRPRTVRASSSRSTVQTAGTWPSSAPVHALCAPSVGAVGSAASSFVAQSPLFPRTQLHRHCPHHREHSSAQSTTLQYTNTYAFYDSLKQR